MPADERYGQLGHKDSNLEQLYAAKFDTGSAKILPILTDETDSLEIAVKHYEVTFESAVKDADFIIAQLGIGANGHIAGIQPGSPALTSKELIAGFSWDDYERLTLTAKALEKINVIYVLAYGEDKKDQLTKLMNEDLDPNLQPAQILKQMSDVYIYNDQLGG
jgi:6-phosphogluconolactonase/glucosamine-6-phosphate isomerase/deaminase